ncbi:hypothetical protein [Streptococcus suis]|uniref:hypothetical protein n=1 Tax=Streptococcus suis TaxID=1307 RepID=UPI00163B25E4|nr:hypothetical protein [Streptococcus suis]
MRKKTAIEARRNFLDFELKEKYWNIDKLIGQRRRELERLICKALCQVKTIELIKK